MAAHAGFRTIRTMDASDLIPALGHPRVLEDGFGDPRRRVVAREGDAIIGVAAFEPLFGPRAEGLVAMRDGASGGLVPYLVDELLERVHESGLLAVRFVFASREQHPIAERLAAARAHCTLRREWLDVRLEPAPMGEPVAA